MNGIRQVMVKNQGFTLIEIFVGVLILSILLVAALPAFTELLNNNRSITMSNNFISFLNYARSEAIKRGSNVSVCPATDDTFSACGNDWTQGWIVILDPNGTQQVNNTTILKTELLGGTGLTVSPTPNVNVITFASSGFPIANSANVSFDVLSSGCTSDNGRNITISFTGQFNVNHINCP